MSTKRFLRTAITVGSAIALIVSASCSSSTNGGSAAPDSSTVAATNAPTITTGSATAGSGGQPSAGTPATGGVTGSAATAISQPTHTSAAENPLTGIPAPAVDAALAAQVPAAFRTKHTLIVGTDATLAPKEFIAADGKTIEGLDIDLTYAVGDVLGLKMQFTNSAFDTLIPGVQNGRFDLANSSAAPTPEREKVVDFATTDYSGEQLLVKKADAATITSISALCGLPVGVERGSLELQDLQTQSGKCTAAGKAAVNIQVFPDANSVNLALSSGRVQAVFADVPVVGYQAAQSHGALVVVGPIVRAGLEAMFTDKGNGLAASLSAAINELIANGTYQKIFAKWGLSSSVLKKSVVNPATEQG